MFRSNIPPQGLPEGWRAAQLHEISNVFGGGRLGLTKADYVSEGVLAYSAAGPDGRVVVTEGIEPSIIVSSIGARCGKSFLTKGPWATLANTQVITPKSDLAEASYLIALLDDEAYWNRSGSAQPFIKPSDIKGAWVPLPPLPEQRRIAEILGSVEAAIEATKAVIEQTKTVKQGLLQTLLTRGIGHTEFKDSPLGEIPQSWEVKPLGEVLTLQRGIDLPVQSRRSGEVPIYGSNGIVGYHNSAPFNGIGVITGRSGTIGTVFVSEVPYHPLNTTLHVVEFFGNSPRFCSFLLEFVDLKQFVAATGVPTLNRNFVHPHQVALPPIDEQEVIANTLMDVGEQIEQEERVLASLKTLKKGLMDDLLTGKVRVNLPEKVAA